MALDWQTEYHRYKRYFININQFYRQKKIRVYTGIVLSIFATAFFIFFAIKPTLVTIVGLVKEISDKQLVTNKLEAKVNALASAQSEYQSVEADLYLVDQALPKNSEVAVFIRQLEALARKSEIKLEGAQMNQVPLKEQTTSTEEPQTINFSVVASGGYQNLKSFLQSISSLRRIIAIDSFAFRTAKSETEKKLNLTLTAKAFFMKENQ